MGKITFSFNSDLPVHTILEGVQVGDQKNSFKIKDVKLSKNKNRKIMIITNKLNKILRIIKINKVTINQINKKSMIFSKNNN